MGNAVREFTPVKYDASSVFTQNFVHKLRMIQYFRYGGFHKNFETAIGNGNYSNETEFRIDSFKITIFLRKYDIEFEFGETFIRKEICDPFNHSRVGTYTIYYQYLPFCFVQIDNNTSQFTLDMWIFLHLFIIPKPNSP